MCLVFALLFCGIPENAPQKYFKEIDVRTIVVTDTVEPQIGFICRTFWLINEKGEICANRIVHKGHPNFGEPHFNVVTKKWELNLDDYNKSLTIPSGLKITAKNCLTTEVTLLQRLDNYLPWADWAYFWEWDVFLGGIPGQ